MFKKIKRIHFVGIGGAGMSGIAEVLLNLGYEVSGSDMKDSDVIKRLKKLGAKVVLKHSPENITNTTQVVVTSTAISKDNPEVIVAQYKKIPVIPRIEMLAELARLKYAITIAGTHGKTTTTSMVALVLSEGGLDPTMVVGGRIRGFETGAKLGRGDYLVAESDESDGSFLKLAPTIAIVTNIDDDHLDYYGNMEHLKDAFISYINKVPFYGWNILCYDDANVRDILPFVERKRYTYGIDSPSDFTAQKIDYEKKGSIEYDVYYADKKLGRVKIFVPGRHNVLNSLCAVACGVTLEISFEKIVTALKKFKGTDRRIQIKGEVNNILVVDDYGHHPTEIQTTLAAVKQNWKNRRLVVLFQPHRYTRTQILVDHFGKAFSYADQINLLDIYPAGEKPIPGINSEFIVNSMKKSLLKPVYLPDKEIAVTTLTKELKSGDVLLTLGAGDVWKIGEEILNRLKQKYDKAKK